MAHISDAQAERWHDITCLVGLLSTFQTCTVSVEQSGPELLGQNYVHYEAYISQVRQIPKPGDKSRTTSTPFYPVTFSHAFFLATQNCAWYAFFVNARSLNP